MATQTGPIAIAERVTVIAEKARRYRDRSIGEQNTKASLIEPMFEALGWDIRDLDEVQREFKASSRDKPVDYALKLLRKPRLFIEAKGLGETLADRKWVSQVLGYATVAGVEWCILTDGNEYRFYNATAAVDADEKLFCKVSLADDAAEKVVKTLNLISRSNLEENLLDVLWAAHFIDRRVRAALESMIDSADRRLVKLIRKAAPTLTPKQVGESLARLDVKVESPANIDERILNRTRGNEGGPSKAAHRAAPSKPERKGKRGRRDFGVTLVEIIAAGLLKTPAKLYRRYKGHELEARLLPDGRVEFRGKVYDRCSTAAEYARGTITGRRMNTNGWSFWQYQDGSGGWCELLKLRQKLMESRAGAGERGLPRIAAAADVRDGR